MLDIGCGSGRVAAELTKVLDPAEGSYEGFDVMPASIAWCQKAIASRHPNFRFQLADIQNGQYNPTGRQAAAEYDFPYADSCFDTAIATSLFTHLRPFEAERYLAETGRVLRPGGRLLSTWFLINEEAEALLASGSAQARGGMQTGQRPPIRLDHVFTDSRGNEFRSPHAKTPEHLIAVDEKLVRAMLEAADLELIEIAYGRWPGAHHRASGGTGPDRRPSALIAGRDRWASWPASESRSPRPTRPPSRGRCGCGCASGRPGAPQPTLICSTLTPFPFWFAVTAIVVFIPLALIVSWFVKRQTVVLQGTSVMVLTISFWRYKILDEQIGAELGEVPIESSPAGCW